MSTLFILFFFISLTSLLSAIVIPLVFKPPFIASVPVLRALTGFSKKILLAVTAGLFLASVLTVYLPKAIHQTPQGFVDIKSRFGEPQRELLLPGPHFIIPGIDTVDRWDIRTQKLQVNTDAASKDIQLVTTTAGVSWHPNPTAIFKLAGSYGHNLQDSIIRGASLSIIKEVTGRYKAEELITLRAQVQTSIAKEISDYLAPLGVIVDQVSIENFEFSEEFSNAIEQKTIAEQLKLKANTDLDRIMVEAHQKIEEARGDAEAAKLRAVTITDKVLADKAIEKWDGRLPAVVNGNNGGLMLDISKYVKQGE